jgi:hypothetical protein
MIVQCAYDFTPPEGEEIIKVFGIETRTSAQASGDVIWRVVPSGRYAQRLGGCVECSEWEAVVTTLADVFCNRSRKLALERLVLNVDHRKGG